MYAIAIVESWYDVRVHQHLCGVRWNISPHRFDLTQVKDAYCFVNLRFLVKDLHLDAHLLQLGFSLGIGGAFSSSRGGGEVQYLPKKSASSNMTPVWRKYKINAFGEQ